MQRLLIVTATYRAPTLDTVHTEEVGSKMCSRPVTLTYGSRSSYAAGLPSEIWTPVLTLQQEFERKLSWTDWKHVTHRDIDCLHYVSGPARMLRNQTAGTRDEHNDGMTPEQFKDRVNSHIRKRRAAGLDGSLPEEFAFLSLEEVLAVRLYSGPAYQPINEFLRQIQPLRGEFLREIVQSPALTFCATIGHVRARSLVPHLASAIPPLHPLRCEFDSNAFAPAT